MALDANGIWQFEEGDEDATASDLFNRLASSTSARVGDLQTSVNGKEPTQTDSGWEPLTVLGGYAAQAGFAPRVRRIGKRVTFDGGISNTGVIANTSQPVMINIPAPLRPPRNVYHGTVGHQANNGGRFAVIAASGQIELYAPSGTLPAYFLATFSWLLD
jgi:hypothetical protein